MCYMTSRGMKIVRFGHKSDGDKQDGRLPILHSRMRPFVDNVVGPYYNGRTFGAAKSLFVAECAKPWR